MADIYKQVLSIYALFSLFSLFILNLSCKHVTYHSSSQPVGTMKMMSEETGWELVWSDEFTFDQLDVTKWSIEENCWGGGNNEKQCYTTQERNIFIKEDVLHLVAHKQSYSGSVTHAEAADYDPEEKKTLPYTSGRIRTKHKGDWTYGRFDIRAKLPQGQGTWPAIWMLPTHEHYGGWAASGEIDIMEAVNLKTGDKLPLGKRNISGALHYGGAWPKNVHRSHSYSFLDQAHPADAFHVYRVEWDQHEIRWYVDHHHYATQAAETWYTHPVMHEDLGDIADNAPFDQAFHLILNLAVGGNWPERVDERGIDPHVFPQAFLIDYVRVYSCSKNPLDSREC